MKKILAFVLTAMTAVGFAGWGAISAHAVTTYTAEQVAQHNTAANCWLIISGQVYDVTNFIPIHPGGNAIVPSCGTDATAVFNSIHNQSAFALLPTYLIGNLGTVLAAPSGLVGTPTQTTIALSWTGSTGGVSPITYTVMRDGVSVGTTTATTFANSGLTASTTYTFVVKATDSAMPTPGTTSSSQISVMTLGSGSGGGGGGGGGNPALSAPSHLVGTPTQTTIALSWTGSTGGVTPVTYTILRNGTSVGTTTGTTFTNTGLATSTTYTFVVKATDSATPTPNNSLSSQLNVTTLGNTVSGGGGEQENEMENEHVSTSTHQTGGDDGESGHVSTSTPQTGGENEHEHVATSTPQTGAGESEQGHTSTTSTVQTGGGEQEGHVATSTPQTGGNGSGQTNQDGQTGGNNQEKEHQTGSGNSAVVSTQTSGSQTKTSNHSSNGDGNDD